MKRNLLFILLSLLCAWNAAAQNASPAPKPTPTPDETEVVKISTNLIQLDVTVTDLKGKPIADIKPEEIEIYENGKKQKITNLSFISAVREIAEPLKTKDKPKIDIPIPTNEIPPERVRRTIALVADDLSLSFDSAHYTRMALKKFVDEQMQEGDLVAIIRTGAGMGSLQQFTSDKRLLYAAIERVRWNPSGTGGIGAFAAIEPTPMQQAQAMGDTTVSEDDLAAEKNRMNAQEDFRNNIFAAGTLGAIRYLINGMSTLPGRKSVIMFSNGFRLYTRDESGYQDSTAILNHLRRLVDFANRASVVIHTIDARGLVYTGYTAADNVTDFSSEAMITAMSDRSDELFETQQGLSLLAKETGGIAIRNNNDLAGAARRILEDQSYYLVAYEPEEETFDAAKVKFNKIVVRVLRKDTRVRTRSGFFNTAGEEPTAAQPTATVTPFRQLMDALSSPFAKTGIQLRLNPLFGHDAKGGSYVRSYLHIDANDLKFTDMPDGKKKAVITIIAASFGENGIPAAQISQTYTITGDSKDIQKLLNEGFIYDFTFPVKKPGGFQYRVAIRDDQAATVGSASQFVQVPKIKKGSPVMSSIVLQNFTRQEWLQANSGDPKKAAGDSVNDTSLRRFRNGTVLQYAFEIYALEASDVKIANFTRKTRVFRDGKMIMDGNEQPLSFAATGNGRQTASGAISLGTEMQPGDYILQIVVVDNSKKDKKKYATQYVQFEVVP